MIKLKLKMSILGLDMHMNLYAPTYILMHIHHTFPTNKHAKKSVKELELWLSSLRVLAVNYENQSLDPLS